MTTLSSENENSDRLNNIVAILIAVATVIGAIIAWRAAIADDQAGGADTAGLNATINAAQTRGLNFLNAYANYGSYTAYVQGIELNNLLVTDTLRAASEEEAAILSRQAAEAADMATTASADFFKSRYLDRNGRYNIQRELGEEWAEAAREKDLNPDPHFANADQQRTKSGRLIGILSLLGLALVFFTLVETVGDHFKYVLTAAGGILMLVSIVATIIVEQIV